MSNLELKIIQTWIFTMQDLFIANRELKDFRKIIKKEANLSELTSEGEMYGMFYERMHK